MSNQVTDAADHDIAALMLRLALAAGAETLRFFKDPQLSVRDKADSTPVTEADLASDRVIFEGLTAAVPGVPVLSEERAPPEAAFDARRLFLVDPLDGTKEFVGGGGSYTINIALVEDGAPRLGAVVAPALGRAFWTESPDEAFTAEIDAAGALASPKTPLRAARDDDGAPVRVVASKSHIGRLEQTVADAYPGATMLREASSMKFCRIAAGEAELYPRHGPTSIWDTAAADAVLRASGGVTHVLEMLEDGSARVGPTLRYDAATILNPSFLAMAGGVVAPERFTPPR